MRIFREGVSKIRDPERISENLPVQLTIEQRREGEENRGA